LPSYRGVMDREGVSGPGGVSIFGDEAAVRDGIRRFADAGTTDFTPVELVTDDAETEATRALLKDLAAAGAGWGGGGPPRLARIGAREGGQAHGHRRLRGDRPRRRHDLGRHRPAGAQGPAGRGRTAGPVGDLRVRLV